MATVLSDITRFGVIDSTGRVVVGWIQPGDLSLSIQDQDHTLKIFLK